MHRNPWPTEIEFGMLDEGLDNLEVCVLSRIYPAEDIDIRWDWYGELFQFEARKTT